MYLQNKERPFEFAGVYDRWKNPETGQVTIGFAIVTTTANDLLQSIPAFSHYLILRFNSSMMLR